MKRKRAENPGASYYSWAVGDAGELGDLLHFWFDGEAKDLAREKWFCRSGSDAQRSVDRSCRERFAALLERVERHVREERDSDPNPYRNLARIVCLDQVSRHILRADRARPDGESRVQQNSAMARRVAEGLLQSDAFWHLRQREQVFVLMPFRHEAEPTVSGYEAILAHTDRMQRCHEGEQDVLRSFQRATRRRWNELRGTERLRQVVTEADEEGFEQVLQHAAFDGDERAMGQHPLTKAMGAFLRAGSRAAAAPGDAVFVSLSGGVDSMVIARILCALRDRAKAGAAKRVVCLHLNYGNREEADLEQRYLERWCRSLGIDLRVERMPDDLRRARTAREAYEERTRQVRFGAYRRLLQETGAGGVMLGHHRGDVEENVLSNALRGSGVLGLAGMEKEALQEGVALWRPLLEHDKKQIFDFAHRFGVPYFKDSTPLWSTRGRLREVLLPALKDIYGDGCLRKLSSLADESRDARALLWETCFGPAQRRVRTVDVGTSVQVSGAGGEEDWRRRPMLFWRTIFADALHSMGIGMLRAQAMAAITERLAASPPRQGWLELRKDLLAYADGDGLFLFRRGFAALRSTNGRPHAHAAHGAPGALLRADLREWLAAARGADGHAASFEVGPWLLRVRISGAREGAPSAPAGRLYAEGAAGAAWANVGAVRDLFRAGAQSLNHGMLVSEAALAGGAELRLAPPAAATKAADLLPCWRKTDRRLLDLIPRVHFHHAAPDALPESRCCAVAVEYSFRAPDSA